LETLGKHPQIPELFAHLTQDNHQYLVQEYIDGQNLAEELETHGVFSETKIRELLNQMLPLLEFIHEHQVIHRDIKPEKINSLTNLGGYKTQKHSLVLVDFGAAKFTSQTTLKKTGTVIGSAAYIAPEQTRGKAVFASDIYSLAITCIYLLTGVEPFDLFDSGEDKWVWQDYLKNSVSLQLRQIIDKMLETATKKRYQTAAEVLNDLNTPVKLTVGKYRADKWFSRGIGAVSLLLLTTVVLAEIFSNSSPTNYPAKQPISASPQSVISPNIQPEVKPQKTIISPPNYGGLYAKSDTGEIQAFPLEHTDVTAKIAGNLSRVEVVQRFTNPYNTPLEATYQFPLPDESAVDDMEIRIGDRVIKGIIKKREEAKKIYNQAKQEGKTAALLEQERPNIFTQSLANIKPGETIEVVIRYTDSLKFAGGDYEFVFPMVVGPRYNPGNSNLGSFPEKSIRLASLPGTNSIPNLLSQTLETPPKERSGHDINVTIEIDAGVPISNIISPSHQIKTQTISAAGLPSITQIQLNQADTIPNKDLVLRYQVAGKETQSTVLSQADNKGGHFAVYLIPALEYQTKEIVPKDVVFLMDTSGSQSGAPLEQSKVLMRRFLQGLNPDDTFTIIDFANSSQTLSSEPLANTPANQKKALNYVNKLKANGGTELLNGIDTVLNFPSAKNGRLRSIVLLTDGLIGNENQIISRIEKQLQPGNRLYSFGVGSSVNRYLLNRLAEVGRGTVSMVRHDESVDAVTEKFFNEINNPVLTNIEVKWQGLGETPEVFPLKPADLFAQEPLVLYGRKQDRLSGNLQITAVAAGGKRYQKTFPLRFDSDSGNVAIAQLWGRAKIKQLMLEMTGGETPEKVDAVTNVALGYRLMSKYTAFVAVSDEQRVDPNQPSRKAKVKKQTPDGMTGIPEPSFVWAILLFGLYLGWKQWVQWQKIEG
ncbi:MAG: VIT domain-containing protein, partial [Trichodesmium sp.]